MWSTTVRHCQCRGTALRVISTKTMVTDSTNRHRVNTSGITITIAIVVSKSSISRCPNKYGTKTISTLFDNDVLQTLFGHADTVIFESKKTLFFKQKHIRLIPNIIFGTKNGWKKSLIFS